MKTTKPDANAMQVLHPAASSSSRTMHVPVQSRAGVVLINLLCVARVLYTSRYVMLSFFNRSHVTHCMT